RYGIPLVREEEARTVDAAVAAARRIGFPVVLKGSAAGLVHKSDAGAVKVGLGDEAAVRVAWREIAEGVKRHLPGVALAGCLVQEMARGEGELIVGIKRDEQFGPFVLVGFGGTLVELVQDVRLAPAPVSLQGALALLRGLRAAALFDGPRGRPPLDLEAACDVVVRLSWLAADL